MQRVLVHLTWTYFAIGWTDTIDVDAGTGLAVSSCRFDAAVAVEVALVVARLLASFESVRSLGSY